MKRLFVLSVMTIIFASCSRHSGNREPKVAVDRVVDYRDVPFRAHKTWFSTVTYDRLVDHNVKIIYADSAYRDGDTITVGNDEYILLERVK